MDSNCWQAATQQFVNDVQHQHSTAMQYCCLTIILHAQGNEQSDSVSTTIHSLGMVH